jgi:serine/threonine protein kinase
MVNENVMPLNTDPMKTFTIIKSIGEGAFGNVLLVEDKQTHANYAMKRVEVKNAAVREQMLNEIYMM